MSTAPENIGFSRLPGVKSIAILHKDGIDVMPDVGYASLSITDAVTLASGYAWDDEFYFTLFTSGYSENEKSDKGVNIWEVAVECFYPKSDSEAVFDLSELERKRFVIDCVDNDGNRRLVGTKAQPLQLRQSYKSGKKPGDVKGYVLVFAAQLSDRPPFYAPP